MKKKKLTIVSELNAIKGLIIQVVSVAIILYLLDSFVATLDIWLMMAIILAISLPTVFLHLNYAYRDKEKMIFITQTAILYEDATVKLDLSSANKIIIKGSVALTRKVIPIFISPNYYEIVFLSDEFGEITVSSLMDSHLKKNVLERFDNEIIEYDYFFLY